jgi:hypothetical protein
MLTKNMKIADLSRAAFLCPAIIGLTLLLSLASTADAQSPGDTAAQGTTSSAKAKTGQIPPPPPLPTRKTRRKRVARPATSVIPGETADGRTDMAGRSVPFYPTAKQSTPVQKSHSQSAMRGTRRVSPRR